MKPYLTYFLRPAVFFAVTVLMFVVQRCCFVLLYPEIYTGITDADYWQIIWHGLSMDCSMAGYLTIVPLVLSMVCLWFPEHRIFDNYAMGDTASAMQTGGREALPGHYVIRGIIIGYSILVGLVLSFIAILDGALYPIWGYKLDVNPFFYFFTSPSTALGVMTGSQMLWGGVAVVAIGILWTAAYLLSWNLIRFQPIPTLKRKVLAFSGLVLMGGLLFVVIRGGVTVSTMNLSRAYFSNDQRLNHAAINPAFSLLSSATRSHGTDVDKYNFYPNAQLPELLGVVAFPAMEEEALWAGSDTVLSTPRPDIVLIILESFSSHLLPALGGEDIAPNVNFEAENGLLFTEAYATGFRTDRGIPAILNGFPSLPDVSVTRHVAAMERQPGLAEYLIPEGYRTSYYYGGDINFTNMNALLVSSGYRNIVSDKDFPVSEKMGKWGVHDHNLFKRVREDFRRDMYSDPSPHLMVIQTSSSHEPFNVPYSKLGNKAANAFAYTDSVVGDFMRVLRKSPRWKNTLVVITSDHYGAYPENLPTMEERHHIPIIFTGGALLTNGRNNSLMSQTDIAPTILGAMGVDNHRFFYGRNVFDLRTPPMVFYYDRNQAYLKSSEGEALMNTETMEVTARKGSEELKGKISPFNPATQLRAWMQAISNDYSTH